MTPDAATVAQWAKALRKTYEDRTPPTYQMLWEAVAERALTLHAQAVAASDRVPRICPICTVTEMVCPECSDLNRLLRLSGEEMARQVDLAEQRLAQAVRAEREACAEIVDGTSALRRDLALLIRARREGRG